MSGSQYMTRTLTLVWQIFVKFFGQTYHSLLSDVKRLIHNVWPLSPHQDTARIHSDDHLVGHDYCEQPKKSAMEP